MKNVFSYVIAWIGLIIFIPFYPIVILGDIVIGID